MKGFNQTFMSASFTRDTHAPLGSVMKWNETTLRRKNDDRFPISLSKLKFCQTDYEILGLHWERSKPSAQRTQWGPNKRRSEQQQIIKWPSLKRPHLNEVQFTVTSRERQQCMLFWTCARRRWARVRCVVQCVCVCVCVCVSDSEWGGWRRTAQTAECIYSLFFFPVSVPGSLVLTWVTAAFSMCTVYSPWVSHFQCSDTWMTHDKCAMSL